jgi:hypothetical protein
MLLWMPAVGEKRLAHGANAREGPRIMRVAVYALAALVFLAGLILDTSAVLELLGTLLWAHARLVATVVLLIVVAAVCWSRLGRGKGGKPVARVKAAAAPRQKRKSSGQARKGGGKRKRAK